MHREGNCYIFDDRSCGPIFIDGEDVHPPWGITKAGKPRKRLAQACISCREKKVKCDPGSPKCLQCHKFGRECRFESAPRYSRQSTYLRNSFDSFSVWRADSVNSSTPADSSSQSEQDKPSPLSSNSRSPRGMEDLLSAPQKEEARPSKRPRQTLPTALVHPEPSTSVKDTLDGPEPAEEPSPNVDNMRKLDWQTDPYEIVPELTMHYLEHYFMNINSTTYCMFPRKLFLRWVSSCRRKTQPDMMVVFALLALGSLFATTEDHKIHRECFAKIACHGVEQNHGRFSLQLIQARLVLSLLHYSSGEMMKSWDYSGAAVRAACGMKLNSEKSVTSLKNADLLEYGFEKETLVECRRRTYWAAYLLDHFSRFSSAHLSTLDDTDCFLRLPCQEEAYGKQEIPITPYFHDWADDPGLSLRAGCSSPGMMGYLVQISSIWGNVFARAYRSNHRSGKEHGIDFESFYQKTSGRLDDWKQGLTTHLSEGPANVEDATQAGYLGIFCALHMLYHCAVIGLNRHAHSRYIHRDQIVRNIQTAHRHAREILTMTEALCKEIYEDRRQKPSLGALSPFTGFAVLSAVDTLTAAGLTVDLHECLRLVNSGIVVLEELAARWTTAKSQLSLVQQRFSLIMGAVTKDKAAFVSSEPIDVSFGSEHDLLYAEPREHCLRAIGLDGDLNTADTVLKIQTQGASLVMYS